MRKPGRPKKSLFAGKYITISVRLSLSEWDALNRISDLNSLSLSEQVRQWIKEGDRPI